jgi:hypothetical protein
MADGKFSLPWSIFLGYTKGKDGKPVIVPKEAETVRLIYRLFMEGGSYNGIAKTLTEKGIPTPKGKTIWRMETIRSILANETYRGDKILQKTFVTDFLTKTTKTNEGEIPQYHLEGSHEAIIPPAEWDAVQTEINRRKSIGPRINNSPFTSKIRCGGCGAWFGPKVWHSNSKYRRTVWQCNAKYGNGTKCQTPHVTEAEVKAEFIKAVSSINREKMIVGYRKEQKRLSNTAAVLEAEITKLGREIAQVQEAIQSNAPDALDRLKRHDEAKERQAELEAQKTTNLNRVNELETIIQNLEKCKKAKFDEQLWLAIVDYVEVVSDGQMAVIFKKQKPPNIL